MTYQHNRRPSPPAWEEWIIRRFTWDDDRFSLEEDLREEYAGIAEQKGKTKAQLWYLKHALRSFFPWIRFSMTWSLTMIKNYFKIAFRLIKKHKGYTFINTAGLVIGMAGAILIFLWVKDEWGFDRFHKNADVIYRVESNLPVQPVPLAPVLIEDYPEITNAVRIGSGSPLIRIGEKSFYEEKFIYADASFFDIFSFPLVKGFSETALADPYTVVLSEKTALKYFGAKDILGKTLTLNNQIDLKVTGIAADPPQNSTVFFNMIASLKTLEKAAPSQIHWGNHIVATYVLLDSKASAAAVTEKISEVVRNRVPQLKINKGLSLAPLKDIHLHAEGHIKEVFIFASVAVFILLLAFINFINLTTARSENRSREVGLRKVNGADRGHLIRQFLGESVIFSLAALFLALFSVRFFLPLFNSLSGKQISWTEAFRPDMLLIYLGLTIFSGIAAGSYPALYLSAFRPIHVFQKVGRTGKTRNSALRRGLVVFQFSITVILVISTFVVRHQLRYIRAKDMGYQKEHIVTLPVNREILTNRDAFQQKLRQIPNIQGVTFASSKPSRVNNKASGIDWEGNNGKQNVNWKFVAADFDYFKTMNMEMAEGRSFSRDIASDEREAFIVNEKAVEVMELKSPVGKWFSLWGNKGKIIGVVKNFHFQSLHNPIQPLLFFMGRRMSSFYEYLLARIAPGDVKGTLKNIEAVWQEFSPSYPFTYGFLDESFDELYRSEQQMEKVFGVFTLLSVFISCLGLLGVAAYTAELRVKEIGIRKVLGATAGNLMVMMSGQYIRWVLLANIIAWPSAALIMNRWLRGFAYRTSLSPFIFILSSLLALAVALLAISYQSVKAATADPVKSLRYE
ncbi:MAG: ABC transporter permease [Candidatus Aminicenantes bacterium]|nr:ABC transporter permease [Candidatus Aminicenantes bacterium]